jgi:hypothetical protein
MRDVMKMERQLQAAGPDSSLSGGAQQGPSGDGVLSHRPHVFGKGPGLLLMKLSTPSRCQPRWFPIGQRALITVHGIERYFFADRCERGEDMNGTAGNVASMFLCVFLCGVERG